ncbi:E3 ubiquitin-protein ligase [Forsythia ovata]|uniref:RING-type E3 ubiquitin transferase n=1 Tax=Forsythia ovata TaxID=205694 RepID=A0ABD1W222_9LAMI
MDGIRNYNVEQDVYYHICKKGEEVIECDEEPPNLVQVNIDFTFNLTLRTTHLGHNEPIVNEVEISEVSESISIKPEEFLCYNKTREIMYEVIRTWPILNSRRRNLIKNVFFTGKTIAKSMSLDKNLLHLQVDIKVIHRRIYDDTHVFEETMEQPTVERNCCNMVPASDSAIKSLKRNIIDDENNGVQSCMVCLDEFFKGSKVISMPCSHVFHSNCIKKWLITSHYCPICRFEMPTN